MKVLVTGACGLLSRDVTAQLEESHELRLFDRNRPEEARIFKPGVSDGEPAPFTTPHEFVKGEITDGAAIAGAVQGVDAIIHLAASTSGVAEIGQETFKANALGTFIIIDEARKAGVKRFLCASSINAFGTIYWRISGKPVEYDRMPLDESFTPVPEDPYSLSKHVNELTCAAFTRAYDITTAAFRFAGVYSEEAYQSVRQNLVPTGGWSDDLFQWVHVKDIARGLQQALECPSLPEHGVYTLAAADTRCPEPTMEILERFRPDLAATVARPLIGRETLMSIDRARETFGYDPQYRLGP